MNIPEDVNLTHFELIIAEDCNYRCRYCFDNFYAEADDCSANIRMGLDKIPEVIDFIRATNKDGDVNITYFGGEPLLNFVFIEKFTEEIRKIYPHSNINLVTNGSLMDSSKINFFVNNNIGIIVSIDGKAQTHDLWRLGIDGVSTWKESIVPAMELLSKRPNVTLNMVINSDTVFNFFDNYKFFIDIGFQVTVLLNIDNEWPKESVSALKEQINKIYENRLPLTRSMVGDANTCSSKSQKDRYCFSPMCNVTISTEGELFFCHRFVPKMKDKSKFDHSYGNIYDGYTNLEHYKKMVERSTFSITEEKLGCGSCSIKYRCAGGCIAAHQFDTGDYYKKNKTFCKIWTVFINSFKDNIDKNCK